MRIEAFYDFYTDHVRPLQLLIKPKPGELDWSETLYIQVSGPFARAEAEDFGDMLGVSVLIDDMTRIPGAEEHLGINLPQIAARYGREVEQLILRMDDVEEVLKLARGYF